ncbi:MAG: beta-ketoacyl-ACP synthase II [Bacteroidales bacterium]|nr:beta-ketoacyl-ACP synthase II [Candidatus Cacconaster equifaecalis]
MKRRVVVTGIGTINPLGNSVSEYFRNLDACKSGARPISRFDASAFKTRFSCEIPDYEPEKFQDAIDRKTARKIDLYAQFAMIAAHEAVQDSRLDLTSLDSSRAGVVVGSGVGGLRSFENEMMDYVEGEEPRFSPFLIPRFIVNIASGHIAIKYGFNGPNFGVSSACATSTHAIMTACNEIRCGRADVMISGGSEAPITRTGVGGFNSARAISTRNDDYKTASRPFDRDRDGFVIGEGAAILVLEEYEHAFRRGADIYAEVAGVGMTCDAYHITAPLEDGSMAARAMALALKDAELGIGDVDYINAHGTSTPLGDVAELNAIKSLFGERAYDINISSTKSMTGHLLGAAGAVEALACIHAIRDGIIPPTINFVTEDENIDYKLRLTLNAPVHRNVDVALCNNFGFGGQNASLILKRFVK